MGDPDPWWERALEYFHRHVGENVANTRLLSLGHCATFVDPDTRTIVRVGRRDTDVQAADGVQFAKRFAPVVDGILAPCQTPWKQPLHTPYGPVTTWPLLQRVARRPDYGLLGFKLRRIHEMSRLQGTASRPAFSKQVATRRLQRLAHAPRATPTLLNACAELIEELQSRKRAAWANMPTCTVHGDAYTTNIITAPDTDYLIDYDSADSGPSYWDLAPLVVENRRFMLADSDLEDFFDGYGHDPRTEDTFREVVKVRELGLITYLYDYAAEDEFYFDELTERMATLKTGAKWAPFDRIGTNRG